MTANGGAANTARLTASGSFLVGLEPKEAFNLFTAAGEQLWVPGWSPVIFGSLPQAEGLVFITGSDQERTIWTVLASEPSRGLVRYSRVTPGSRAGIVTVNIDDAGDRCKVTVTYDLTAIGSDGEAALAQYEGNNFHLMLNEWQELITNFLQKTNARQSLAEINGR